MSLILTIGILSSVGNGWNKPGHMVTGAIAYEELKNKDQKALQTVLGLLKKHYYYPEWEKIMNAENISESDRDLFLFMYAARWADDIRNDKEENRSKWHYINHPIKFDSEPASVQVFPPDNDNIEKAWVYNVSLLKTGDEPAKEKAVTWIFHLAGDSHQPLHATALYTTVFQKPGGDQGGNLFFIKAAEDRSTINLHSFWDGAITGSDKFGTIRNIATEIRNKYPKGSLKNVKKLDLAKWTQESLQLAKEDVYLNGNLKTGTKENGEEVPSDYPKKMKEICEKRVALAGYRLAGFLSKTY
ncbi:MAG TPA: S1/P1 nuclease [Pyrinomonadaceae bacterium]|nr:S1/P1 nuclease [Pyrinomonadaceae bacterium]